MPRKSTEGGCLDWGRTTEFEAVPLGGFRQPGHKNFAKRSQPNAIGRVLIAARHAGDLDAAGESFRGRRIGPGPLQPAAACRLGDLPVDALDEQFSVACYGHYRPRSDWTAPSKKRPLVTAAGGLLDRPTAAADDPELEHSPSV
jgi:hypothetical protein